MERFRLRTVDGYDIATVLSRADIEDVVVWMHGISVDKDEYLGFFRDGARSLATKGITSIRFDFRGHGESSGSSLDFSVVGQNLDARAVLEFAKHEFPSSRMHVVAASFGAPPALFAAARYPDVIRSVALISPVLSYERTFLHPETDWGEELFSRDQMAALYSTGRLSFDSTFCVSPHLVEEMWIIRPAVTLKELKQEVLVIHGDKDSMVPYDASVESCRGLLHVRLVTLEGADHGFTELGDDDGTKQKSRLNREAIYRLLVKQIKPNG